MSHNGNKNSLRNLHPQWTKETAPRKPGPGRPKGSGIKTIRQSMIAQLAEALVAGDPRTAAEIIAYTSLVKAAKGDHRHAELIRRYTEADRIEHTGSIGVVYVDDWRGDFDSDDLAAAAASRASTRAAGSAEVQLAFGGAQVAQNHNGNGNSH